MLASSAFKKACCEAPDTSRWRLCRVGLSRFLRRGGLRATAATFSCPVDDELEKMPLSEELPESVVVFSARLNGLFGEALRRERGREGVASFADLAERRDRRPVGRKGVKLDCCDVLVCCDKALGGAV